jgi:catalase
VIELGVVKIEELVPENAKEQKHIIFDPIPRVKGVEPSADPLLEMRAAVYLLSGRERRAAP